MKKLINDVPGYYANLLFTDLLGGQEAMPAYQILPFTDLLKGQEAMLLYQIKACEGIRAR